jgi:hypothetical protein
MKKEYYTYAYLREDKTPWYIGKGKGRRAYQKHDFFSPPELSKIIFLKKNLTEKEAYEHEIYMISIFGRKDIGTGILRNKSNGGDHPPIFTGHTQESKNKISKTLSGRYTRPPMTEDEKRKRSIKNKTNNINPPLYTKPFKLISPSGEIYEGDNINEFCLSKNLSPSSIYDMRRGKQKQHKGWRLA